MLKHIGLSLCLCLMAMGLNSIFVASSKAITPHRQVTDRVTNGVSVLHQQGATLPARHPAHAFCSGVPDTTAQRTGSPDSAHRTRCAVHGRFFRR